MQHFMFKIDLQAFGLQSANTAASLCKYCCYQAPYNKHLTTSTLQQAHKCLDNIKYMYITLQYTGITMQTYTKYIL